MQQHRRLQAANRTLAAEKQALNQELFDERSVTDNLRARIQALESENLASARLLENLRGENDMLDEMRRLALSSLEDMQQRQDLSDLGIPKLPQPLDTELERFAQAHPDEVEYDAARGTVKWKGDLLFPLGSAEVNPSSRTGLQSFSSILKSPAAADFEVIVAGHTDNRPIKRPETKRRHPTNWHLSAHRAIAVAEVLEGNGYGPDRIGVMGCGEYRPVAPNGSESGQSQNRRVEIYLVPRGSIITTAADAARAERPDTGPALAAP